MNPNQHSPSQPEMDDYWNSFPPSDAIPYRADNVHHFQQQNQQPYRGEPQPPYRQNSYSEPTQPRTGKTLSASTKYPADYQLAVYGSKAAIQVKPCATRKGFYTISLEAAGVKQGQSRVYDWEQKIVLQLTRTELLDFAAVLLCHKPACEYSAHGENNDKGFKLAFQPERRSFYLSLSAPRQNFGCQVPYLEAMQIGHLCLSLYIDNYPGLTTDSVLLSLNQMTQLFNTPTTR